MVFSSGCSFTSKIGACVMAGAVGALGVVVDLLTACDVERYNKVPVFVYGLWEWSISCWIMSCGSW